MLTDKFYVTSGNQALINSDWLPQANSDCNSCLLINKNEPVIIGNLYKQLHEESAFICEKLPLIVMTLGSKPPTFKQFQLF